MAEIEMKNLVVNLDGKSYRLIGSRLEDICNELGISEDRFIELLSRDAYCPTLSAAPTSSTLTYIDTDGSTNHFSVGQLCRWAEGSDYRIAVCKNITSTASAWYTFPTKVSELTNDGGYVKSTELASVAKSGSYNDLSNKPTIPSAVTESTVSGWGFTKNTGTYSKPSGGIPKTDLASAVQTSLGKADTALQSYTETDPVFKASAAAGITSANITSWNGKQDASLKFTDNAASTWVSDSIYADYPYRCDIACTGVTASMYAEVTFSMEQATSGDYAPVCETKANVVSIWSKKNTSVTVPTILITK